MKQKKDSYSLLAIGLVNNDVAINTIYRNIARRVMFADGVEEEQRPNLVPISPMVVIMCRRSNAARHRKHITLSVFMVI